MRPHLLVPAGIPPAGAGCAPLTIAGLQQELQQLQDQQQRLEQQYTTAEAERQQMVAMHRQQEAQLQQELEAARRVAGGPPAVGGQQQQQVCLMVLLMTWQGSWVLPLHCSYSLPVAACSHARGRIHFLHAHDNDPWRRLPPDSCAAPAALSVGRGLEGQLVCHTGVSSIHVGTCRSLVCTWHACSLYALKKHL